jgi:hypothetical protein
MGEHAAAENNPTTTIVGRQRANFKIDSVNDCAGEKVAHNSPGKSGSKRASADLLLRRKMASPGTASAFGQSEK